MITGGPALPPMVMDRAAVAVAALVSVALYPPELSYQLLAQTGAPAAWAPLLLYGAALCDLLLGLGTLLLKRRRALWLVQLGLIGFYTVLIAWKLPQFLIHPYGPLTKNVVLLAAIWLLYQSEEK